MKTFDCVALKRDVQLKLRREYEARRSEFSSYVDFVNATADESEWVRRARAKMTSVSRALLSHR